MMNFTPTQQEVINQLAAPEREIVVRHRFPVGHDKTLMSLVSLLYVKDCKKAVWILPKVALETAVAKYDRLAKQECRLPSLVAGDATRSVQHAPLLHLITEQQLSSTSGTEILNMIQPDFVIVNEQNAYHARLGRLAGYVMERRGEVTVLVWT